MLCDTCCGNGYSSVSILTGQGRSQELSGVSGVVWCNAAQCDIVHSKFCSFVVYCATVWCSAVY